MNIRNGKISWDHEDFQGHPDLRAYPVREGSEIKSLNLHVRVEVRHGRGHVLPDGDYVFPGDNFITRLETLE